MSKRLGVALSGGGARGAYQIGVLKALQKEGFLDNLYAISGSSVGSLNAVLLAMDDLSIAEKLWLNPDMETVFVSDKGFLKRLFEDKTDLAFKGYYDTKKFEQLIEATIDFPAIYNHRIYVTTSYVGDEHISLSDLLSLNIRNYFDDVKHIRYTLLSQLEEAEIKKTLMASCAIPVVFKPVIINGETHYDGGVLDNTPCTPLADAGCDEILLIDLFKFRLKRHTFKNVSATHIIVPSKNLRGILDFSHKSIEHRFKTGLADGEKFIKKYRKQLESKTKT